jgi:hypothetical protein
MDLFRTAAENGARLDERAIALCEAMAAGAHACFASLAGRIDRDGRIAINMRQSVLLGFLRSATYQNIYEWARGRAKRSPKSEDEILRERLGPFYERRVAFDRAFEGGERFRYGALSIGGAGASAYGSYCAVIADEAPRTRLSAAYLPSDSLATYVRPMADGAGVAVNTSAIESDVAPHTHRQKLAAIKIHPAAQACDEGRWPALLCSATDYVEALFVGDLAPGDLQCVRMTRSDYDLYFTYAFEDFRARLAEPDRVLVEGFASILDELDARGIALEVVDD